MGILQVCLWLTGLGEGGGGGGQGHSITTPCVLCTLPGRELILFLTGLPVANV